MKITTLAFFLFLPLIGSAQQAAPAQAAPAAEHGMMMSQHGDIAKLVERLENSFAIMDAEKDPALLKKELAEHGALLKELQAKVGGEKKEMCCKGMKEKASAEEAKPDPHAEHHH